ncbi:hypothetical protein BS50DRAFT_591093 [Corynespora cassiicola Philippines]|uniref:Uncharacterized protein n=1 Tax=Corynespora cassiicola Philippines TaxID=1448308 RepID=A0A2T2NFV3_CORCC|nr:hypothetical protein BS50DRAFT_591093 [Corynespora cassiicola Philippines]
MPTTWTCAMHSSTITAAIPTIPTPKNRNRTGISRPLNNRKPGRTPIASQKQDPTSINRTTAFAYLASPTLRSHLRLTIALAFTLGGSHSRGHSTPSLQSPASGWLPLIQLLGSKVMVGTLLFVSLVLVAWPLGEAFWPEVKDGEEREKEGEDEEEGVGGLDGGREGGKERKPWEARGRGWGVGAAQRGERSGVGMSAPVEEGSRPLDMDKRQGRGEDRERSPQQPGVGQSQEQHSTTTTTMPASMIRLSVFQAGILALAFLLFVIVFAILVAHCLAWFVVYKTEVRLGEVRRGVMRGGEMRVCLCAK